MRPGHSAVQKAGECYVKQISRVYRLERDHRKLLSKRLNVYPMNGRLISGASSASPTFWAATCAC